jgi:hypothetical protein
MGDAPDPPIWLASSRLAAMVRGVQNGLICTPALVAGRKPDARSHAVTGGWVPPRLRLSGPSRRVDRLQRCLFPDLPGGG